MWATGLVVCVTGFNAKFKQEAKAAVVAAGGTYTPALSRKVTHLVVASGIDNKGSEKLETARKKVASGAWKVVVVSVRWLQLCVTSSTLHPTAEHTISFEKRPQRSVDISGAGSGRPHPADSYVGASVALTAQCSSDLPSSCLQSKPRPESAPSTSRAQDFGTAQGSGRAAPVQSAAASSKSHDAPPVVRAREPCTPQFPGMRQDLQQSVGQSIVNLHQQDAQPQGPPVAVSKASSPSKHDTESLDRGAIRSCPQSHAANAEVPPASDCADVSVADQTSPKSTPCPPVAPIHCPSVTRQAIVRCDTAAPCPEQKAAACDPAACPPVSACSHERNLKADAASMPQACDAARRAVDSSPHPDSAVEDRPVVTGAKLSDPGFAASDPVPITCAAVRTADASRIAQGAVAAHNFGSEPVDEPSAAVQRTPVADGACSLHTHREAAAPAVPLEAEGREVAGAACVFDPGIAEDDAQCLAQEDKIIGAPSSVRGSADSVPDTENQGGIDLVPPCITQIKSSEHHHLQHAVREHTDDNECPAHEADAEYGSILPMDVSLTPASHALASNCVERCSAENATDVSQSVQVAADTSGILVRSGVEQFPASPDVAQCAGTLGQHVPHAVVAPSYRAEQLLDAGAHPEAHSEGGIGRCVQGVPEKEPMDVDPVGAYLQRPKAKPCERTKDVDALENASRTSARAAAESDSVPDNPHACRAPQAPLVAGFPQDQRNAPTIQPSSEYASVIADTDCPVRGRVEVLCHESASHVSVRGPQEGMIAPDHEGVAEHRSAKALAVPEKDPPQASKQDVGVNAGVERSQGLKHSSARKHHSKHGSRATMGASILKAASRKSSHAHLSTVAKAAAQQELVSAAAAQRAKRGVLGGCGEILSRGPLQPPWCLYWSDEASRGHVVSKSLSECEVPQVIMSKTSIVSNLQPVVSPGPSCALKSRILELSVPADVCQASRESPGQVHGTLDGTSFMQHSSFGESANGRFQSLNPIPDLEGTTGCHDMFQTIACVKRTHEALENSESLLAVQGEHTAQGQSQRQGNDECDNLLELASVLKSRTHTDSVIGESSSLHLNYVGLAAVIERLPDNTTSIEEDPRHSVCKDAVTAVPAQSKPHDLLSSKRMPSAVVDSVAGSACTAVQPPVATEYAKDALQGVATATQATAVACQNAKAQQDGEISLGRQLPSEGPQSQKRPGAEPSSCYADLKALLTNKDAARQCFTSVNHSPDPTSDPRFQTKRTVMENACHSSADMLTAQIHPPNVTKPALPSEKQVVEAVAAGISHEHDVEIIAANSRLSGIQLLQDVLADAPAGMLHSELGGSMLGTSSPSKRHELAELVSRAPVAGSGHAQVASSPEETGTHASALAAQLRAHQHDHSLHSEQAQVSDSFHKQSGNLNAAGSVSADGTRSDQLAVSTVQPLIPSKSKDRDLQSHCQKDQEIAQVDAILGVLRNNVHPPGAVSKAYQSGRVHENPDLPTFTETTSASCAGCVAGASSSLNGGELTQMNALRDFLNNTSVKISSDSAEGSPLLRVERPVSGHAHHNNPDSNGTGEPKSVHKSDKKPAGSSEQSPLAHQVCTGSGSLLGNQAQQQHNESTRQHAQAGTHQINSHECDLEGPSPEKCRADAHVGAAPSASYNPGSRNGQATFKLPPVATEGDCNTQLPDFQLSPAVTDEEQADTPRLGLTVDQTFPDQSPATQTPTDSPTCQANSSPKRSPTLEHPNSMVQPAATLKRQRDESDEENNALAFPPTAHPNISDDNAGEGSQAATSPGTEVAASTPPSVLPSQPALATQPVEPSSTENPAQSNMTPLDMNDACMGGSPRHNSHCPPDPAPTPAITPLVQTLPVSRCDAAQGCSDGSGGQVSGGSSGGRGRAWNPGSVLGGLMGRLGSMSLKRLKTSPVVDSLPVVAPPRLLEGINWRLATDFSAALDGQLHNVVLRCPTVTLVIPRCTAAWRSCVQHSMVPAHASPAVFSQRTMDNPGTQLLETQGLEPDFATQVENPGAATPPPTQVVSMCLTPTASVTPALREVTNTQDSAQQSESPSQQSAPDFSQSSVGRVVGFTQAVTPVAQPKDQERAGKVSVVLESERRAFTTMDVLQAVRGALQDVKSSEFWVFDGLHKISAAGKQPVVYETVFML